MINICGLDPFVDKIQQVLWAFYEMCVTCLQNSFLDKHPICQNKIRLGGYITDTHIMVFYIELTDTNIILWFFPELYLTTITEDHKYREM